LEKSKFIPYGRQDISEEDIEAVISVLRSDFLTQGLTVSMFEQKLCDYTKAKYTVAVNSCTSALHIACLALDLGRDDVLWTSPITFVASANCALYCGATVDFIDIEPDTGLMSIEKLKKKLEQAEKEGGLPKIVVSVHFSGQPCDMKEIYSLGQQYGFKIIEDAAHAIGAKYCGELVGNCHYSDITVFSFHPVKVITTGEGGAALTNDLEVAEKMQLLRSHGITKNPKEMTNYIDGGWYYEQKYLGFNYRMTDMQAALGISQLDRIDEFIKKRRIISDRYNDTLKDTTAVLPKENSNCYSSNHLYVVRILNFISFDRKKVFNKLRANNIGVNVHYIPIYRQPYFKIFGYNYSDFPGAEQYYSEAISLPIFPALTEQQQDTVIKELLESIL
jgi:UDP-4-amino-4,6-dideoxy-N-acetyl-beta-L-altrosamine transaminase